MAEPSDVSLSRGPGCRAAMVGAILVVLAAGAAWGDENLKTPYVMLDPATQPPPSAAGAPVDRFVMAPAETVQISAASVGSLPQVVASTGESGATSICVTNGAVSFGVTVSSEGVAKIVSLKSLQNGIEFLADPSAAFHLSGAHQGSSDAYRVVRWRGLQYPEYAELVVDFRGEDSTQSPASVRWRTRLRRSCVRIEQSFEAEAGDLVLGQVLKVRTSFRPVMPANLFGRGFSGGRPDLVDRRRFEYTDESEHLCYDAESHAGLWGFVGEIGGQERIASGAFALIQNPSFRTRRSGRAGPFVIEAFAGPVEVGFCRLRQYLQQSYTIQKDSPSPFEWNQFWLWQGGPVRVDRSVVSQQRLLDVLPRLVAMGLEEFHLDDGWQQADRDWHIDRTRFPGGWETLRDYIRTHGLGFHLWTNDGSTDSASFTLDLIDKTGMNRLFMDRRVSEETVAALEQVRATYPGLSTNAHNSTSRSVYWPWGNVHFLSDLNQIYFGEGQFWAWSNIRPEAKIEPRQDPLFPQLTEAERFFSRHDLYAGDLITRSAAYQAHWVWPYNCVMPPHNGWCWFEQRPVAELRNRLFTYLACKFKYEWGFDPRRLPAEAIELHLNCTAWFKANRDYLAVYQHVLDPPDGENVDAAGHLVGRRGYVFLFNPSDREQQVEFKQILWEPELQLRGEFVTLSDWTAMIGYTPLPTQNLAAPSGTLILGPKAIKVLGINLPCEEVLTRVHAERNKISAGTN